MRGDVRESSPSIIYRIEIGGHIDGDWSEWFGNLALTNLPSGNTTLSGSLADQAALHGLINKVFALGLSLISLNQEVEPQRSTLWLAERQSGPED